MKEWSNLAKVVTRRTYSRRDSGTLENWNQTVERTIMGNVRGKNVPDQEIKDLIRFAEDRKCGPAGRGYWFSGAPAHNKIGGTALVNCWFLTAGDWHNFVVAQDLLMLGGGVGLSVEHQFVSKLPRVKKDVVIVHKPTKDADFIIPDSREGWCELTNRILESFFVTSKSFSYSTFCVRGKDEPILGFGGTASGPLPIIEFVKNLCTVLVSREGRAIRPIDAADILTSIASLVVSGNVRRSACLIQGDCWDKEYLKAKRWDLGQIPPHRANANYSVVCEDIEDVHPLFWKTYEQGEPFGIINRSNIQKYGRMGELKSDSAIGVNPCQPEWAKVLTPEGVREFKDIAVGSTLWSGKQWTKVVRKISSGIKEVYSFVTRYGCFEGTTNHRVFSEGEKKQVGIVGSIDVSPIPENFGKWSDEDIPYLKNNPIISVCPLGRHEVFDITVEAEEHTYWTDGLLVSNCGEAVLENFEPCNLAEIALPNLESVDEFEKAARLMLRYTKRVTTEKYHHKQCDEVIKRNRRVGVGITGCLASPLFTPEVLDRVYHAIQDEDLKYSAELGIPVSKRTTVVKPSGTMSKVLDCMGYEGIHAAFSRYMIQRVRFSSSDELIPKLRAAGHRIEPQNSFGSIDPSTMVVDFYQSAPEGFPVADEGWDTWKQLEVLKMVQKHWADQSVSVTVYYKREDIPKLKTWLAENLQYLKTISFLCHNDHGFLQAPKEAITKEQYEKLSKKIKPINFDDVGEGSLIEGMECEGGACPLR